MKKFLFFISLVVSSLTFGQEEVPYDALGAWYNLDGEVLIISRNEEKIIFVRKNATRILATGEITMDNGDMHINRYDTTDAYRLGLFIGNETMVITRPNSIRAWLWTRIQ
tara:strand:- start:2846 stop:3175 length:330 start_codon:yes stop_codon:yes gene_type:complete